MPQGFAPLAGGNRAEAQVLSAARTGPSPASGVESPVGVWGAPGRASGGPATEQPQEAAWLAYPTLGRTWPAPRMSPHPSTPKDTMWATANRLFQENVPPHTAATSTTLTTDR